MKLSLTALAICMLVACQQPMRRHPPPRPKPATVCEPTETVRLGDLEFRLVPRDSSPPFGWKKTTGSGIFEKSSEVGYVRCHLAVKNLRSSPVKATFMPVGHLTDESGRLYDPDMMLVYQSNLQDASSLTSPINPQATRVIPLIFEAPPGDYMLRVIVPNKAYAGFMWKTADVEGPYFYYRLPIRPGGPGK